ncbi:MAG: ribonuclease Z [Candidatus Margulisbacteria bacterium]|nr:ribonuclease Z [Candidatus Margulisiibacteriota bacterium]
MPKIKVAFLGTNGWYDTKTGNTLCILIETPHEYVILDAGNGIYKIDQYMKEDKPIHLFLSHFHLDHIIGLHILAKFSFPQGMTIHCAKGGKRLLNKFVANPLTAHLGEIKLKVKIAELGKKNPSVPFLEKQLFLHHKAPCLGFRFNFGGKVISFIPDTGICDNAIKLAQNADLLITESAFLPGHNSAEWPHLNPETGALIAKKAKAKKLALVHFDAAEYPTMKERKMADKCVKKLFKNSFAAVDDQVVFV